MLIPIVIPYVREAWCRETAHPSYRKRWSKKNRAYGQCCVTALLMNYAFGFDVAKCKVGRRWHYFNITPEREIIDLTREQFGDAGIDYYIIEQCSVKKLLAEEDVRNRFELLKQRWETLRSGGKVDG